MNKNEFLFPESEKLFVTLIISGMIFLTLTGFNIRFLPCDSVFNYCSFNYLCSGESYNLYSYFAVVITFVLIPYLLACVVVEWFK
jgi:hypothetical protein